MEFTVLVTIAVTTSRFAVCLCNICCSGLGKLWSLLPRLSQYTVCLSGRKSFSPWQRPLFWIRRNSTARSSVDNSVTIQLHASNLIMFGRRGAGCDDETQGVPQQTRAAIYCVIEFQCIGLSLCICYTYFLNWVQSLWVILIYSALSVDSQASLCIRSIAHFILQIWRRCSKIITWDILQLFF